MGFRPCPWALPEQQQGAGECKGAKRPELLPCGVSKSLFCPGSHHSTAFPLPGDLNSALGGMGAAPQRPRCFLEFLSGNTSKGFGSDWVENELFCLSLFAFPNPRSIWTHSLSPLISFPEPPKNFIRIHNSLWTTGGNV